MCKTNSRPAFGTRRVIPSEAFSSPFYMHNAERMQTIGIDIENRYFLSKSWRGGAHQGRLILE
jgi:hypothetical protein